MSTANSRALGDVRFDNGMSFVSPRNHSGGHSSMNHAFLKVHAIRFPLASLGIFIAKGLLTERVSVNLTTGIKAWSSGDSRATSANGYVALAGETLR
jgi:hypothetical protein